MRAFSDFLVLVLSFLGTGATLVLPNPYAAAQPDGHRVYLPSLWSLASREELPRVATTALPARTPMAATPEPTPTPWDTATLPPAPGATETPTPVPTSLPEPTATPVLGGSIYGRLKIDSQPVFPGTGDGMGPALYLQRCRAGGSVCENIARTGAW